MEKSFILGVTGGIFSIAEGSLMLFIGVILGHSNNIIDSVIDTSTLAFAMGAFVVAVGVVGIFGAVKGGKAGAAIMIFCSVMVFFALTFFSILPAALLFLGGVVAFTEKPAQKQMPPPRVNPVFYGPPPPPVQRNFPQCPTCGAPIRFVAEYQRWYCDRERRFV